MKPYPVMKSVMGLHMRPDYVGFSVELDMRTAKLILAPMNEYSRDLAGFYPEFRSLLKTSLKDFVGVEPSALVKLRMQGIINQTVNEFIRKYQ